MKDPEKQNQLYSEIFTVVSQAKQRVYQSSNKILLQMYWQIGKLIVEDEQKGNVKAMYGKATLKNLAKLLTIEFGKGFDESNLRNIRQFYLSFQKRDSLRHELSWTHYRILSRLETEPLRNRYTQHCIEGNWDTRTLQRNIKTQYIGRILEEDQPEIPAAKQLIKDPYIFEFLGITKDFPASENNIETALINHIQHFLMELGKGIDLVFYNYYLKCFILIDLKTRKLSHEAIGQMDMYVRMYNDLKKGPDDQPTLGMILCTEKDETLVKYSVLAENEKLFASKYRLYLPDELELKQLIEQDRMRLELDQLTE